MAQSSKRKTKKEQLIQLLTRKAGVDVGMISDKLRLADAYDPGGADGIAQGGLRGAGGKAG